MRFRVARSFIATILRIYGSVGRGNNFLGRGLWTKAARCPEWLSWTHPTPCKFVPLPQQLTSMNVPSNPESSVASHLNLGEVSQYSCNLAVHPDGPSEGSRPLEQCRQRFGPECGNQGDGRHPVLNTKP